MLTDSVLGLGDPVNAKNATAYLGKEGLSVTDVDGLRRWSVWHTS